MRLPQREALHLALDAVLIDELAAGEFVEAQPQHGDAVLIGDLRLPLARGESCEEIVAEDEIAADAEHAERGQGEESAGEAEQGPRAAQPAPTAALRIFDDDVAGGRFMAAHHVPAR
jgi:hypothetical protein